MTWDIRTGGPWLVEGPAEKELSLGTVPAATLQAADLLDLDLALEYRGHAGYRLVRVLFGPAELGRIEHPVGYGNPAGLLSCRALALQAGAGLYCSSVFAPDGGPHTGAVRRARRWNVALNRSQHLRIHVTVRHSEDAVTVLGVRARSL